MRFANPVNLMAPAAPADWPALKADVVAGLDLAAEFEALGVRFSAGRANAKGLRECHAVDRPDEVPSAFVNVETGVYHDSGGTGETLNLFDFAFRHGGSKFGRWLDVVKHYAAKAGVDASGVRPGKGGKVKEATYLYHGADGGLAYAVFRYRLPNGRKTFTQHPPDGAGGWRYGAGCMDGIEPVPYRLPDLLRSAAEDEPVWVVEGEKDADRLVGLGLVATTNHQGAQSTDRTWPRFKDHFRGREVIVLPDNDPGGLAHAARVAGHLQGIARSVKVVPLPGLGPKGDVSDWLDSGRDIDELGRLAKDAPEWAPGDGAPTEAGDPDRDATVADLRVLASVEGWLWPLWIPEAALTLLAAEGGTGKTRFCFDLHRRIHQGQPWPDGAEMRAPRGSKLLWVAADNQHQELIDIAGEFGVPDELVVLNAKASDPYEGTSLQTEEELADFEARIRRVKPALVVIDTITNTGDFKSQDSSDAKRQYKPLQEIAIRCQVPILCVTHLNAGGKVLGRRAVEKVRVVIQMEYPDPEGQPFRRKLWVSKSKAVRPPALGVTMGDGGNAYDLSPPEAPGPQRFGGAKTGPPPAEVAECMAWLAQRLADGAVPVARLRTETEARGWSTGTLYKARDRSGVVEDRRGVRNHMHWSLPRVEAPPENAAPY